MKMKKRELLVLFLLLFVAIAVSAQKRAFTLEDLYRVKVVGDPQVSPDGKTIAFTVEVRDFKKSEQHTHIYAMDVDGKNMRQLTSGKTSEYAPRWSPDGKTLAFISDRGDGMQLWLLPINGGEAKQLTHLSTGVSNPVWSPDSKMIAFATEVFPECGANDSCNKVINESIAKGPIHAHIADQLLYRHWTSWSDGRYTHTFIVNVETGEVKDMTPGKFNSPPFSLGGAPGYAFSPDSKELCYVSNHDPDQASSTNADLWVVSTSGDGRDAKNITASNKAYDGDPQYSPDGRYIAYRLQKIPGYESDRFRLALYDRTTGEMKIVTESFDNWVDDFAWAPDSKSIYFTGEVEAHTPLYRVTLGSETISAVVPSTTVDAFSVSPKNDFIAFLARTIDNPDEVYRVDVDGGNRIQLTFENKALREEVDFRPGESIWVDVGGGVKVQVFIIKPHGFDPKKKYPLILNVHGGPQQQWLDAFRGDWQMYPGAGYVVAFANPRGSTGYGQAFTAAISGDWGGKVFDDLMKVTDALEKLPFVDKERMGAMGWSYGGYMMNWFEGHTTRFKALASMMGVYDLTSMYGSTEELWFPEWELKGQPWNSKLYEKWSPSNYVKNFKTPCLIITGERDYRVPYTQSLEFFTALQKMGVPSRLIVFEHDGHWPNPLKSMPLYYNAHLDWFHKYLGGAPAPYDMEKMIRNEIFEK